MRFALTADQQSLALAVRDVMTEQVGTDVVRAAWDADCEMPAPVTAAWSTLAELGTAGLLVPEDQGGLGLDESALVAVMEEIGYAGVPFPVLEKVCAAPVLTTAAPEAAAAVAEDAAMIAWAPSDGRAGNAGLVAWGSWADYALLGGAPGSPVLRLGDVRGATVLPTVDRARPVVRPRPEDRTRERTLDVGASEREQLWLRGVLGTAASLVGLGRRMVDMTRLYVGERQQFGRPVGSFQAVKHHLAQAHSVVEFARPAVWKASWTLAQVGAVPGEPEATAAALRDAARDVAAAKLLANRVATGVAPTAIQCHGGMGFTTENDLHLFAKRSWASAASFGTDSVHRDVIAGALADQRIRARTERIEEIG